MKHTFSHSLPIGTVRTATKKALSVYEEKFSDYDAKAVWTTEDHADVSFVALGKKLEGTIDLNEKSIDLDIEVPFLMKPFQGKAVEIIEKEIKKWIGKAENGELEETTDETPEDSAS